jgi:hypothetical protein
MQFILPSLKTLPNFYSKLISGTREICYFFKRIIPTGYAIAYE